MTYTNRTEGDTVTTKIAILDHEDLDPQDMPAPANAVADGRGGWVVSDAHGPAADLPRNPIIRTTPLRAYPGYSVRQYTDGTFDACDATSAVTPVFESFDDTIAFMRQEFRPARTATYPRRNESGSMQRFREERESRTATGPELNPSLRTNWQRLDDGSWGIKVQGNIDQATGHTGKVATVTSRNGRQARVTLGAQVQKWNAGRAAVYQVA